MSDINEFREATYKQRSSFWQSVGQVDGDVLAPVVNPAVMGGPAWPDNRQAYVRVQNEDVFIIATDGLSDAFSDSEEPNNGHQVELYVEVHLPGSAEKTVADLSQHWTFSLVQQAAMNAAYSGSFRATAEQYKVFSMEFFDVPAPAKYITDQNRIGVLIGAASERVNATMDTEAGDILVLSVVPLTAEQTAQVVEGGQSARDELVEQLMQTGKGTVIDGSEGS